MNEDFQKRLKELLLTLTPRQEKILTMMFFDCKSTAEIAKHFGVSRERILQILERASKKIAWKTRAHFKIRFDIESLSFVDLLPLEDYLLGGNITEYPAGLLNTNQDSK